MGTAMKKKLVKKAPVKRKKKPLPWDISNLRDVLPDKEKKKKDEDVLLDTYNVFNNDKQLDYVVKYYTTDGGGSKLVLLASHESHWSDHVKGQELMSLTDTGNDIILTSDDTSFDYDPDSDKADNLILDYAQAEYVRILFHMKRTIIDTKDIYSFQVFKNQKITEL